jgi:hypothetical protein
MDYMLNKEFTDADGFLLQSHLSTSGFRYHAPSHQLVSAANVHQLVPPTNAHQLVPTMPVDAHQLVPAMPVDAHQLVSATLVDAHDILSHAAVLEALFDYTGTGHPQPRCHPETRQKILDNMCKWVTNNKPKTPILWLSGAAGAGKSAIMRTTCQRLQDAGYLVGSFFFKRGDPIRDNANVLFTTLAYQLTSHSVDLHQSILQYVKTDPAIVKKDIEVQLGKLIVQPCLGLEHSTPVILLIDGLDECGDPNAQKQIMNLIGNTARRYPLTIQFIVASRPEAHIGEYLKEKLFSGVQCAYIEPSFTDVQTFLRAEFTRIHQTHSAMKDVPAPWPSDGNLDSLVQKSSGYFLYTSTVIKCVDNKHSWPTERLKLILRPRLDVDPDDNPFAALDQLYIQVLSTVPAEYHDKLLRILGCWVHFNKLSIPDMEKILGLEADDFFLIFRGLDSLFGTKEIQRCNLPMLFCHQASFIDFLLNGTRSGIFYVGPSCRMHIAQLVLGRLSVPGPMMISEGHLLAMQWSDYLLTIPPCEELVPGIKQFHPDWLFDTSILDENARETSETNTTEANTTTTIEQSSTTDMTMFATTTTSTTTTTTKMMIMSTNTPAMMQKGVLRVKFWLRVSGRFHAQLAHLLTGFHSKFH